MSNQSRYVASELFNGPVTTGGANTNDWVASMRGMVLMYAGGDFGLQTAQQAEDAADVEIARARLAEIEKSPGILISGKSLRKRLSRIET